MQLNEAEHRRVYESLDRSGSAPSLMQKSPVKASMTKRGRRGSIPDAIEYYESGCRGANLGCLWRGHQHNFVSHERQCAHAQISKRLMRIENQQFELKSKAQRLDIDVQRVRDWPTLFREARLREEYRDLALNPLEGLGLQTSVNLLTWIGTFSTCSGGLGTTYHLTLHFDFYYPRMRIYPFAPPFVWLDPKLNPSLSGSLPLNVIDENYWDSSTSVRSIILSAQEFLRQFDLPQDAPFIQSQRKKLSSPPPLGFRAVKIDPVVPSGKKAETPSSAPNGEADGGIAVASTILKEIKGVKNSSTIMDDALAITPTSSISGDGGKEEFPITPVLGPLVADMDKIASPAPLSIRTDSPAGYWQVMGPEQSLIYPKASAS